MSSKNFNSFKDFQFGQIQTSSHKLFTAYYACSNSDLNLTPVTGTNLGGLRLTCFDCKKWGKDNSILRKEGALGPSETRQEKKIEIHLPCEQVNFIFHLSAPKYNLPEGNKMPYHLK